MSEIQLQKAILDYLAYQKNIYFIRSNSFAGKIQRKNGSIGWIKNNKKGCPDIIVCRDGKFIGLEVKTDKGRMSDSQKQAQDDIIKSGGWYYIVKSLEDVMKII